jgi:peptide/nickel transport system substrate-binding protein
MNDKQRNLGRVALYATVIGSLAISVIPAGVRSAAAQGNTRKIGDFDVAGRFLEVWSAQGNDQANTYVNGLPITARRAEISTEDGKSYDTQWFERAKYEAHPENKAPYDVLLGRLGAVQVEGRSRIDPATGKISDPANAAFAGIDKPADANGTSKVWFQETKHSVSGKILEYWNKYGGLQQFGFPLSEAFTEASTDGKNYTTQYFERARFEVHPEKADPYAVELGLLGVQQYKATPVAADKLPFAPIPGATTSKTSMVIGSQQEPQTLTIFDNAAVASRIHTLLGAPGADAGLVERDPDSNVYPVVAWYVPTVENGGAFYVGNGDDKHLVVKYKLRHGIKWSDGNEITSNDAVYYFKLVMDPKAPVTSRAEQQKLENVDNPDKYTVLYNYRSLNQLKDYYNGLPNKADYAFLKVYIDAGRPAGSLVYDEIGSILPSKALQNIPADQIKTAPFASAPVGFGPWKVANWSKGQEMNLVPNENYNLTAKPLIQNIKIKFVSDGNQLISQAKTGALDLIFAEAFNAPPTDVAGLKAAGFSVVSKPATTWEHIDFYFNYGPFKELAVRQAIMQGINRKRVSDVVYAGTAAVMQSVVPPLAFHSEDNPNFAKEFPDLAAKYKLDNNDYNPDNAKKLLDSAGWVVGSDGIRAKGGVKLSFEYGTTNKATRVLTAPLVAADLKAIGVDAQTKFYGADPFFNGDNTDPRAIGQTKFAEFAYVGAVESDFSSWTCDQRWNPETFAGANEQQYCNHDLDQANGEFNISASRHEMAEASAKAQQIMSKDVVVVPLVALANIEVVSDKLQNFHQSNSQFPSTTEAPRWTFK